MVGLCAEASERNLKHPKPELDRGRIFGPLGSVKVSTDGDGWHGEAASSRGCSRDPRAKVRAGAGDIKPFASLEQGLWLSIPQAEAASSSLQDLGTAPEV